MEALEGKKKVVVAATANKFLIATTRITIPPSGAPITFLKSTMASLNRTESVVMLAPL